MTNPYIGTIKETRSYDVVVCGGGCAGVLAAVASARAGAKTILVERNHMIGGMATAGMVNPFMTCFDGRGERQIVKGLFEELVRRCEAQGAAIHPSKTGDGSPYGCFYEGYHRRHNNVTPFRSDYIQLVMLQMLEEAGAEYLVNVTAVDVIQEGSRVTGIVLFDGNDLCRYEAKIVIDCTGDAFVSYKAGAVKEECREDSGYEVQPMTTGFSIYNADDETLIQYAKDHPAQRGMMFQPQIEQAMEEMGADYIVPRNKIGLHKLIAPGEWNMNCTRIQNLNNTVPREYAKAYKTGLEQVFFLMDFIHTLPGLENARLKQIAPVVGARESRRIEGIYTLEAKDLCDPPTRFDDSIAMGSFLLDLHPTSGSRAGIDTRPIVANCFQIPYRILVPKAVDGLLVAGRCVSGSRDAMSSIRVMPQAFAMGQAAGEAAAICVEQGIQPRDVDVALLQDRLLKNGAVIE